MEARFQGRRVIVSGGASGIGRAVAQRFAAEEVAAVIAFLASDEASYVTGALWAVDGGWTAI